MRIASRPLLAYLIFLSPACKQSAPADAGPAPVAASTPLGAAPAPAAVAADVPEGADAERDRQLATEAGRFIDAFVNGNPHLTPDGKQVVFRSNRDGLPQLYVADASSPRSPARRLVQTRERVNDYRITPDGKNLLFLSDRGADELHSLYLVPISGGAPVEISNAEKLQRQAAFVPESDPTRVIYQARAKAEAGSRIYDQPLAHTDQPRLLWEEKGTSFLADVDGRGKRAIIQRLRSSSDMDLIAVDLDKKAERKLYPPPGRTASITDAVITRDGQRVLLTTDGGGEQAIILALDFATGAETARYVEKHPATAHFAGMDVGRADKSVVAVLSAGDHAEVRIFDAAALKPGPRVDLPLGASSGLAVSNDGTRAVVAWSTPSSPPDLWSIDLRTGKVAALRADERPTLAGLPRVDASLHRVPSFDGTQVPLNLYLPAGLKTGAKLPAIVSVHGGPAGSSMVRWSPLVLFWIAHGFAVVEPNVRGSTGFGRKYEQADDGPRRMDAVRDLEAVGRWTAAQPWADASKLVVAGGSYGGYMTLMGLTHQPELWKAGVDLFGVYDWRTFMKTTSGVIREIFQKEIGPETDLAFYDSISPASRIDRIVAPLFVYAGENDMRVPRTESDQIVKSLRDRKVPVEYMIAHDEGHSLARKENQVAFYSRSLRFLETRLALPPAAAAAAHRGP